MSDFNSFAYVSLKTWVANFSHILNSPGPGGALTAVQVNDLHNAVLAMSDRIDAMVAPRASGNVSSAVVKSNPRRSEWTY